MEIKYGSTRIVLVFENVTIKIARIRPILAIKWLYSYLSGSIEKTEKQKTKPTIRTFIGLLIIGIPANIVEYLYSRKNPNDKRIFRILFCLLGLINIQERGVEIRDRKRWKKHKETLSGDLRECDLDHIGQFATTRSNDEIRIVDYGQYTTIHMLSETI